MDDSVHSVLHPSQTGHLQNLIQAVDTIEQTKVQKAEMLTLPMNERIAIIKQRYGLSHGKSKRKRRKNK